MEEVVNDQAASSGPSSTPLVTFGATSIGESPSLGSTIFSVEGDEEEDQDHSHSSSQRLGTPNSSLRTRMAAPSRSETRFVFGLHLNRDIKVVDQVLAAILTLLQELQKLDETASLLSWKKDDRNECPPITENNFPEKLSGFQKYCETFRTTYPLQDKRWYTSLCVSHVFSISPSSLLTDLDELIKAEDWFFIECAVQTDKKVVEIGWFAYSLKEYASPEFRDHLAELTCVPSSYFALQWQNVKQSAKELWAMTVKAAEGPQNLLDRALGQLYSSSCSSWPWGIRMRYVPYASTLNSNNPVVTNIKTIQVKFLQTFKPLILENLRVRLDHSFETADREGNQHTITVRQAIMGIQSPRKGKKGEILRIFHGVVEYNDRRFGRRVIMVPYPSDQVGSTLGLMMAQHPFTILSYYLKPESIQPLFLTHAVEAEMGATYDEKTDSLRTPAIIELEQSMVQDAVVFDFDLKLVEKDRIQAEKKRKHDGQLVKRLDDSSIGTLRADSPNTAAGSSRKGTRPSP